MACAQCKFKCRNEWVMCLNCKMVVYCTKTCLLEAWPRHKSCCYNIDTKQYAIMDGKSMQVKKIDEAYMSFEAQKIGRRIRNYLGKLYEERIEHMPQVIFSYSLCRRCKASLRNQCYQCENCERTRYCNLTCYFNDWKKHRSYCFNELSQKYAVSDPKTCYIDREYLAFEEAKLLRKFRRKSASMQIINKAS